MSVRDVAEYILRSRGEMTAMKLQKLVYYCQAWHRAVSIEERRAQPSFLWHYSTFINNIAVRVIYPHEADQTPRVERLRCTVEPVDASKPSYTGDPHDRSRLKIGSDQEGTDAGSLNGLFPNGGQQLCQDRITILVPDGSIQP